MSETIIRTENLSPSFGAVKAVDSITLDVPAGIVFGFLGPNSAGKTTTFYLLLAFLLVSLLISLLAVSGGVLVSLRTATVRQAQQILLLGTLVLGFLIVLTLEAVPSSLISGLSSQRILFIVISALVVLDAILLGISLASFHRSKLILS